MTFSTILIMCLCAMAGGITQAVTGFGSGVIMMMFIPMFLPVTRAAATSAVITLVFQMFMVWTYRKHIQIKYALKPILFYMAASTISIRLCAGRDVSVLKIMFGIFLVLLSLYFLLLNGKLKVKGGWLSAGVCGTIAGTSSGLFGIGGPPMVVYYMSLVGHDKKVYLGSLQAFFLITGFYNMIFRIMNGILTVDLFPFIACGVCGIIVGKIIGTKIVDHINVAVLTKLVYLVLGLSGVINVISALR